MTRLSAIAMVLVLTGCVVGPSYQAPKTTAPEHWSGNPGEPDSAATLQTFWTSFGDPVLTGLIQQAIESNYDLKIAGERIRAAHDAVRVAASGDLPQIGIGAATESRRETQTIDWPPASPKYGEYPYYALGFNASWELDLFGETQRRKESARAAAEAASGARGSADTLCDTRCTGGQYPDPLSCRYFTVQGARRQLAGGCAPELS